MSSGTLQHTLGDLSLAQFIDETDGILTPFSYEIRATIQKFPRNGWRNALAVFSGSCWEKYRNGLCGL